MFDYNKDVPKEQKLPNLESIPPRKSDGSLFMGYKTPAAYFSNYLSQDQDSYLEQVTGKTGNEFRDLLQSSIGPQLVAQSESGQLNRNITYLSSPGFGKGACSSDGDCATNQLCFSFGGKIMGSNEPRMCRDVVYPEMALGNAFNDGKPLRQESNSCQTDKDCEVMDPLSGRKKQGMACNHFYRGDIAEPYGLCQVTYNGRGGKRFFLPTPAGWDRPLNKPLMECSSNADCGPTGIDGWSRCVSGSADGKSYCLWPGETGLIPPAQLQDIQPATSLRG